MADTQEFGECLRIEVGLCQDVLLFYTQLEDCHQLTVILQICIALTLDVLGQYLAGHLSAPTQFHIFFQLLGEVEVALNEKRLPLPEAF